MIFKARSMVLGGKENILLFTNIVYKNGTNAEKFNQNAQT